VLISLPVFPGTKPSFERVFVFVKQKGVIVGRTKNRERGELPPVQNVQAVQSLRLVQNVDSETKSAVLERIKAKG